MTLCDLGQDSISLGLSVFTSRMGLIKPAELSRGGNGVPGITT